MQGLQARPQLGPRARQELTTVLLGTMPADVAVQHAKCRDGGVVAAQCGLQVVVCLFRV